MFRAYSEVGSDLGLCYLSTAFYRKVLNIGETSFSPSVKWVWWIKEAHRSFAMPPVERWNLIPLPLNLD